MASSITDVDRVALQWLLATGVGACALLGTNLAPWVIVVFVTASAWRYGIERFQVYRPNRWLLYGLLAVLVLSVYRSYGTILGREPGLTLLVALLGLKLLELRNKRDAVLTLFFYYIVLAGAFLYAQTVITAFAAMVIVVMSLITLIRLQQPMPIAAGARLTAELLLKAVPLMLILYLLFPRIGGSLWGMPSDAYSGITGISDSMRPGSLDNLSESDDVAFRADFFGGAPPAASTLYWRGIVLWTTDGQTWLRGAPISRHENVQVHTDALRYRITLEPSDKRWLFALDLPLTTPENAKPQPGFTFEANEPIHERLNYTLTSATRYSTGSFLSDSERRAALQLPPLSARLNRFAMQLSETHPVPMERVQALLQYIREQNYVYTLSPPLLGDDPVDEFFFDTRRGFCEHYAAAFATLLRATHIPARVVIGYQGGELNPDGNYLIVYQSDAHAWVEAWFDGRGWTRVDPTAAIAPERIEYGINAIRRLEARGLVPGKVGSELLARALRLPWLEQLTYKVRMYWDYSNVAWYRWVVDYRKERQEDLLHKIGFETIDWTQILWLVGGLCALILLAYVVWSRRGAPTDPALRLYRRFCRKLARAGINRAEYEGPLAYAQRAGAVRPDLASSINAVTERYLHLRYGHQVSNDDLRGLAREITAFKTR